MEYISIWFTILLILFVVCLSHRSINPQREIFLTSLLHSLYLQWFLTNEYLLNDQMNEVKCLERVWLMGSMKSVPAIGLISVHTIPVWILCIYQFQHFFSLPFFFDLRQLFKGAVHVPTEILYSFHGTPDPSCHAWSAVCMKVSQMYQSFLLDRISLCPSVLCTAPPISPPLHEMFFPSWLLPLTWYSSGLFSTLAALSSSVDSCSRSFLVPKTDLPFVPPLCYILGSVPILSQSYYSIVMVSSLITQSDPWGQDHIIYLFPCRT